MLDRLLAMGVTVMSATRENLRGCEGRNWRMQYVASTLHTTSENVVSSITTADGAHLGCQQSTEQTPTPRADLNGLGPFRTKDEIWFLRV